MLDERASEVASAIHPRRAHGVPPAVLLVRDPVADGLLGKEVEPISRAWHGRVAAVAGHPACEVD
eukprot:2356859-Alexandrium_andersonii.AAC.1